MMIKDTYFTIEAPTEGLYKDKGSKFFAYATPLSMAADFPVFLEKIKKEHPKARHYCYAWRVGVSGTAFRTNDDGEPSGTAGRPILGQIDSFGLTHVGVVVVRYFGGTLLGTSGLIAAYKESTALALAAATKVERLIENQYLLHFNYERMPDVMNAFKRLKIPILSQEFTDKGQLSFAIRQSEADNMVLALRAAIYKITIEEAKTIENDTGFDIILSE